jgi:hypothetical protein
MRAHAMVGSNGCGLVDLERKLCYHYYNLSGVRGAAAVRQPAER